MSLFTSLATASTALQAFTTALGAEQVNVSNSATAGFAALRAAIQPLAGSSSGGSDTVEITSTGSLRADALVQSATSQAAFSQTSAGGLEPVNQLFDITGSSGILASLQRFSAGFSALSVSPNDPALRSTALDAAGSVASAFRNVAAGLDTQRVAVDSGIQDTVGGINRLAGQIRQFNVALRGNPQVDPATDTGLREALSQLSALTGITVSRNTDGTVSVLTGGQQPLVTEDLAFTLSANPSASAGSQISSSGGGGSPSSYSGRLGALLDIRNGTLRTLLGSQGSGTAPGTVNDLAKGFASRVNALLASGATPSGSPGVPVFTYDSADSSNVARTLAINPAVTPDQLALASGGASPQSNGIAVQLAGLPSSTRAGDQIAGFSSLGLFSSVATDVGQLLSDARNQAATDRTASTSAQAGWQQASGVSLDQEAVAITAFQRSYEASAKIVSILDQLTSVEVNLIK